MIFTKKYINIATKRFYSSYFIFIVQLRSDSFQLTNMLCYADDDDYDYDCDYDYNETKLSSWFQLCNHTASHRPNIKPACSSTD